MIRNGIFGMALAALMLGPAAADPTGTYRTAIPAANGHPALDGRVTVRRRGESYRVVWFLNGKTITDGALGGAFNRGNPVIGPAHPGDLMLVIGFHDGDGYGSATMILQVDSSYEGFRVTGDSETPVAERWTPLR